MSMVITDSVRIKACQEKFRQSLIQGAVRVPECHFGFQGGYLSVDAYWSPSLGFCVVLGVPLGTVGTGIADFSDNPTRYWNAFSLRTSQPTTGRNIPITVEINFPLNGRNARIQGAFVEQAGKILMVHRGRINGGDMSNIRGTWVTINDPGPVEVVLIGELEASDFPEKVRDFVKEVARIKEMNRRRGLAR